MSLKEIPDFCMYGTVMPQLWYADPKATVPEPTSTCQLFLNSGGANCLMSLLTLAIVPLNLSIMSSGVTCNSLISLSTLLMNRTGLTFSFSACLTTVSVCGIGPSTAHARIKQPSTALIALVTSPPKST